MKHTEEHIDHLLPDYLDGNMEKSDAAIVEAHIAQCQECKGELAELRVLIDKMDKSEYPIPSDNLRKNFYQQLELEKRSQDETSFRRRGTHSGSSINQVLKIAASIALLIGAFFGGKYHQAINSQDEIADLQDTSLEMKQLAMLSLMENKSASKRIQGVGYIEEFAEPDPGILQALIQRMRYDENTNVRLTATEALARFRHSGMVKDAFIRALGTEMDPGIQISIIKTLSDILDQNAIVPLRELMDREETQPFVKAEIETLLPKII